MSVKLVNIGLINDETLIVEFSDQSYAAFTVNELLALERSKKRPDSPKPEDLSN